MCSLSPFTPNFPVFCLNFPQIFVQDRSIRANLASNKLIDQALSHSAGASNNRQWQFFSGQLRAALERMGQVRIPQGNATEMKEVREGEWNPKISR